MNQPALLAPNEPATGDVRFVLQGVSWSLYERMLEEFGEHRQFRMAYDDGDLEFMSPLFNHESLGRSLGRWVVLLARAFKRPYKQAGSTTLRHELRKKGIEPDDSFFLGESVRRVTGKERLDMRVDPSPDLGIEVDITHSSLNRQRIYAKLGVAELWRLNEGRLQFLRLSRGKYVPASHSDHFPGVQSDDLQRFLERLPDSDDAVLDAQVERWAKKLARLHRTK